jgi:hypothetical protein
MHDPTPHCISRWLLAGCLMTLVLSGCGRPFTRPNFETIYVGMTDAQVRSRIGPPDRMEGDRWVYRRQRPYRRAVITFQKGVVVEKEWSYQPPSSPAPSQE